MTEVSVKPKWPQPAEILPNVEGFCSQLYHIALLDYVMSCNRVEPNCYLMHPPPRYLPRHYTIERCLESLHNHYMRMMCMLNDSKVTDHERMTVQNFPAFIILQNWLPKVQPHTIVKMPYPSKMDHKDYVFMLKECNGWNSELKDFMFFLNEEDRDKFQRYLWDKYPQTRTKDA